jgi:nitrogen fixation protein FixH
MNTPPAPSRWGTGVIASFAVFVAAVLVMVYIAMSQRVDLVTDRYYDQALRYQERIDAQRDADGPDDLRVVVQPGELVLRFPAHTGTGVMRGSLVLYRPADMSRDVRLALAADSAGVQRVSTTSLERGLWRVKVEWTIGGKTRYHEEAVLIQ